MKFAGILMCFVLAFHISTNAQSNTIPRTKNGIISYLNDVIAQKKVIVGQHCQNGLYTALGYNDYVAGLMKLTGRYPALIGLEYGYTPNNDLTKINSFAIEHWKRGGLITISWHVHNPWIDGYNPRWNSIQNKNTISLSSLLKDAPDSKVKQSYRDELLKVGAALKQLQDNGVIVLWRPFHEMNSPWFWWGANSTSSPTNVEAYRELWKDMYKTFTSDLGLRNLIWIYSPNATGASSARIDVMYPGTRFVDVVGVDLYTDRPEFKDYATLKKFNKPIVVGEFGPNPKSYGAFDELGLCDSLRGKAAYFLQWNGWKGVKMGIKDNLNFNALMNNPYSVTLKADSNSDQH